MGWRTFRSQKCLFCWVPKINNLGPGSFCLVWKRKILLFFKATLKLLPFGIYHNFFSYIKKFCLKFTNCHLRIGQILPKLNNMPKFNEKITFDNIFWPADWDQKRQFWDLKHEKFGPESFLLREVSSRRSYFMK